MHEIDKKIAELDIQAMQDKLKLISNSGKEITPRDYQWLAYSESAKEIGKYQGPFIVNASVGAGKTIMMAMLARRFSDMGMRGLVLARQAELIKQNSEAMWDCGVDNSKYSAGLKAKSVHYPIVAGTEKSIYNGLYSDLDGFAPLFIMVDEAHMVDWEDLISDEPTTVYAKIIIELRKRCLAVNKKELRIIGFTGSPFRHIKPILGDFWKKQVCEISSDYLVNRGFLVPTIFGDIAKEDMYDLSDFHSDGQEGAADYTAEQLRAMQKKILSQGTKTQKIMLDVMRRTANRNGVLITCSGKQHCLEASYFLPEGSYVIVTESMGMKAREKALEDAKNARVKYVFQIGCLTTGVDCSYWDTSVLLRKIGSLTLLIQLLGRGMRLLKDFLYELGFRKEDHLVLDFTDTMAELGALYNDPILEAADLAKAKKDNSTQQCPDCKAENSPRARRCIGMVRLSKVELATYAPDWDWNKVPMITKLIDPIEESRCEYFFSFKKCEDRAIEGIGNITGCGAKNDPCARQCRKCGQQIFDPNAKLNERFYTDDDYVNVTRFKVEPTKSGEGLLYRYWYEKDGKTHSAREVFMISRKEPFIRNMWKMKGVIPHVRDPQAKGKLIHCTNVTNALSHAALIAAPVKITHRINDKGNDVINRKVFEWDEQ
ncbi:MAG: hypothetical protein [Caudoviricetes sp.]|nr:MAG: hypothetical protein [Caudoviricetes sp.]